MRKTLITAGAGVLASGALVLAAAPAHAATFISGHTDIVSVACSSTGTLTVDTFREDGGHISPANIGQHTFLFDDSNSPAAAITYGSGAYTVSGNESYEDEIPFIGFQYASAASSSCPASVSFDVAKVSGGTNAGDATFTANESIAGTTSSAASNTNRVTLWKPGTANRPSHIHGTWKFAGPQAVDRYTLQFTTYRSGVTNPVSTISPVNIRVQP